MTHSESRLPVNLTNPGQFFACCGLLELAGRIDPGAEAAFEDEVFTLAAECSICTLLAVLGRSAITNTMTQAQWARLEELSRSKKENELTPELEAEKKALEALRRESPIVIRGEASLTIDWFRDDYAGGSRFKTWAGQQSVLDIADAMHRGIRTAGIDSVELLWTTARKIGLPFNFDSDLGSQGSALDIGFSFDPLAASESTRIEGVSRPALELLCFIGLQRFRPLELEGRNRFVYAAWRTPVPVAVAPAFANTAVREPRQAVFEFPLLYRTKYLKSFVAAQPFQGETHVQRKSVR